MHAKYRLYHACIGAGGCVLSFFFSMVFIHTDTQSFLHILRSTIQKAGSNLLPGPLVPKAAGTVRNNPCHLHQSLGNRFSFHKLPQSPITHVNPRVLTLDNVSPDGKQLHCCTVVYTTLGH